MKIDKSYFDKSYFSDGTKSNYGPYQIAEDCFDRCTQVVEKYHPNRLLDYGCAMGFFVAQFRFLGVEAYGIDISKYAIDMGKSLDFCVSSNEKLSLSDYLFENDGRHILFPDEFFDLSVSWDTLEHIPEKDIHIISGELNRVSKKQRHVIATKSEDWDKDKSHITIKPISWWRTYFPDAELYGSSGETV